MWDHARLLRFALLVVSVLSLSGLHSQRGSLSLLVTVGICLPCAVATVAFLVTTGTAWEFMFSLTMFFTVLHALFLLVYLLRYRREMLRLVSRVAELEQTTSTWRKKDDYHVFQRNAGLVCGFVVITTGVWLFVSFSKKLEHPNYILPARLPEIMLTPSWYPVVMAAQFFFCLVVLPLQVLFEVLLLGMADAVTVFMARLGTLCENWLGDGENTEVGDSIWRRGDGDGDVRLPDSKMADDKLTTKTSKFTAEANQKEFTNSDNHRAKITFHQSGKISASAKPGAPIVWTTSISPDHPLDNLPTSDLSSTEAPPARFFGDLPPSAGCLECPHTYLGVPRDLDARLRILTSLYSSVRRLAEDCADFCSLPVFLLHATVAGGLMLGSYVCIILFSKGEATTRTATGFVVFEVSDACKLLEPQGSFI